MHWRRYSYISIPVVLSLWLLICCLDKTLFAKWECLYGNWKANTRLFCELNQVLIEVPYVLVQATLYGLITYSMLQFQWTAAKFFWYFYILFISLLIYTFYGMMMVAITPNFILASIVSAFFYTLFNLFTGFLIPRPVSTPGSLLQNLFA
jgi:ABC-type multidrug transport system permease subunit